MTTIICDGTRIISDGYGTGDNGELYGKNYVKFYVDAKRNRIYALSGVIHMLKPMIKWWTEGADPAKHPGMACGSFVVCEPRKHLTYHKADPYPDVDKYPLVMGSGWKFAKGALDAGADIEQALKIATQNDAYTGGRVRRATCPWAE